MSEFVVALGIGNVAARRHIEIVQLQPIVQGHGHMAGMALAAKIFNPALAERPAREHSHAVIGLLAVDRLVDIAKLVKRRAGKQPVFHLGLLQA